MRLERLERPLSIDSIREGGAYVLLPTPLVRTNLFLKVGCLDELYIKMPSERGLEDYRRFVKLAQAHPEDARALAEAERYENLEQTLKDLPALSHLVAVDPEIAHYLAVHKLQYERLRGQTAIGIPQAKFALARSNRFFGRMQPALFQERVPGTTLWDMYDFAALRVKPHWRPYLPVISAQLSNLLDCGLLQHLDWNIQNFVFDETYERLFYVDLKPAAFVARSGNEHNLKGIRDYFIV